MLKKIGSFRHDPLGVQLASVNISYQRLGVGAHRISIAGQLPIVWKAKALWPTHTLSLVVIDEKTRDVVTFPPPDRKHVSPECAFELEIFAR